ncbi:class I SAM-dependent methyltransferase [Nocardia heshunensis]
MTELIDDAHLEQTAVVANTAMNRDRRLAGYRRELGFDPVAWLLARPGPQRWLDIGCGSARALSDAAGPLAGHATIIGLDLVGYFGVPARDGLDLVTGSVLAWQPTEPVDLITSVHAVHYVGDKLGALSRMASWLTVDGHLATNFEATSVRGPDDVPLGRVFTTALRDNGFQYNARTRRLTRDGHAEIDWNYRYVGANPHSGPNYTGQDAVTSHYIR